MDPLSLLPASGVFGTLAVVVIYLMRQNATDRRDARAEIAQVTARYTADLREVRAEITSLKETNQKVLDALDSERQRRYAAEEIAAELRRRYGITEGTP